MTFRSSQNYVYIILILFVIGGLIVSNVILDESNNSKLIKQIEFRLEVISHISGLQKSLQAPLGDNPSANLQQIKTDPDWKWIVANIKRDESPEFLNTIKEIALSNHVRDYGLLQKQISSLENQQLTGLLQLPSEVDEQRQLLNLLILGCGLAFIFLAILLWLFRARFWARFQCPIEVLNFYPYPVLIIDCDANIIEANQAARDWDNRLSTGLNSLLPDDLKKRLFSQNLPERPAYWVWQYLVNQHELECTVSFSPAVEHYALFLRDITQTNTVTDVQGGDEVRHQCLLSRQVFTQRVDAFFNDRFFPQEKAAFILIALDRFKVVQASIGHEKGDALIKTASERLQHVLFTLFKDLPHQNVYRFEHNVFALVLQGYETREEIDRLASAALQDIGKPYHLDGREFHLSASVGISVYPENGRDSVSILKNAESALLQATQAGGNRFVHYSREMNAMAAARLEKENYLRYAVERNELGLLYQPQIDLSNNQVSGVEALLRWNHPAFGVMSPDEFIPLAGEIGLISELTEWALREACYQKRKWESLGFASFPVAINISAEQFLMMDLPTLLAEVLAETQLCPTSLELEITENVAVQDVIRTKEVMQALRDMDIRLAIDDFGTGFATMSYLKAFPVDKIKIDKEFVQNLTVDIHDAAICRSIITLANNLNIKVIAEGVDSERQLSWLRDAGCHEVQGYYFYPPLHSRQIKYLLKAMNAYRMA